MVPRVSGLEQASDVVVRDQRTLRPPRRARGVDDIRKAIGRRHRRRIHVGARERLVQQHALHGKAIDIGRQTRLRHEDGHARVLKHEGDPVFRIRGVERQVGAAGLQDADDPDHHFDAALDAQADELIGGHAQLP